MKFKSLFIVLPLLLIYQTVFSKNNTLLTDSIFTQKNTIKSNMLRWTDLEISSENEGVNKSRLVIVGGSLVAALGSAYWYVQNSWWSDKQIPFHFDDGSDLVYALNVDKAGHFLGGLQAADIFSSTMKWAGMKNLKSLWHGALFGTSLQLAIEMKDAYAPYWGFSKWDLALGTAGAFWPIAQNYNNNLEAVNFKFSYYKRSNIYWDLDLQRGKHTNKYAWQDDYPNQTYWVSFDINYFSGINCWPDWLNIALGFGIDDTQYLDVNEAKIGGQNEWYVAFDYDIPKLLKKWKSPIAKTVKHWCNYFHLPAPTIRISPKLQFYPLFL